MEMNGLSSWWVRLQPGGGGNSVEFSSLPVVRSGVYVAPLGYGKSYCSMKVPFVCLRKCEFDGPEC